MKNSPIRIEQLPLLDHDVPEQLRALFDQAAQLDPQFSLPWLQNIAATALPTHHEAMLLIGSREGGNVAVLPIMAGPNSEISALGGFYTSLYAPLMHPEPDNALLVAMLSHLRARGHSALTLAPMDDTSEAFKALASALPEAGWKGCHRYYCFGNWFHEIHQPDWQAYYDALPSRVRNTVKRKSRSFLRDDHGRLAIITGGNALESAIDQYTEIYHQSWKNNEPFPTFIPTLLRLAAEQNWLRLGMAYYDDNPVASQIWLVNNGTAYIFKLAYKEQYAQHSPGTVLTAHLMQHVMEVDRVTHIDYLSGDDTYKQDWMSSRRERFGLAAYNPGSFAGALNLCAHTAKHWIKKLRG